MYLDNLNKDEIMEVNVPYCIPLVYELGEDLKAKNITIWRRMKRWRGLLRALEIKQNRNKNNDQYYQCPIANQQCPISKS